MMYKEGCFFRAYKQIGIHHYTQCCSTSKCEKHHTISLMSHVTKLDLLVIFNRIKDMTLNEIAAVQYGFMPD